MQAEEQSESSAFLMGKALEFYGYYMERLKEEIQDRDVFGIIDENLESDLVLSVMQRSLSPEQLRAPFPYRNMDWEEIIRTDNIREMLDKFWSEKQTRNATRRILGELIQLARKKVAVEAKGGRDVFAQRFREIISLFQLSGIEQDVLLLAHLLSESILETATLSRKVENQQKVRKLTLWLSHSVAELRNILMPDQKLRRYQLLDDDFDFNDDLSRFLYGWSDEPLEHKFYARMKGEVLPWNYFGTLTEKHGKLLEDMIRNRNPQRGLHILLYGAPGSGKTSFAHSLARQLGMIGYLIAQDVRNDNTARTCSTPEFRFGALRLCDERVDQANSLLVVDEADDLLRGRASGGGLFALFGGGSMAMGDKGLLNSLLDEVKTPCIWISNTSAEELDPSSRRRFDYSIRFNPQTANQRLAIWRNNVEKLGLKRLFPEKTLERLAERYEVSAGGVALVLHNVADLKPKSKECEKLVEKLMTPHCELMQIQTDRSKLLPAADYSLEGLNIRGDLPLARVVEAIRRFRKESVGETTGGMDRPRMNLLLSGPPGTGKTEFVKYLGAELGTKVVVRMGSDILSMWVGGTEQNIRRAFEEAEAEKAILFFDEIDGLLQDRGMAQRSWEVTQVNELLHRMETFNGVMVGATNFWNTLDPAVARRFTFKLEFGFLGEAGKRQFFERTFRTKLTAKEVQSLSGIPDLAPGDFRTVRQGLYYLGGGAKNADLLAALERESEAKGMTRYATKKIGF